MIRQASAAALLVLAACSGAASGGDGGNLGTASANDGVITYYDATFHFTAPEACSLYVVDRVVEDRSYVGEYDARETKAGIQVGATYLLSPSDALPLRLALSIGSAEPFLSIALSQDEVTYSDSAHDVLLDVKGYETSAPTVTMRTATAGTAAPFPAATSVAAALHVAQCQLPAQPVLGAVPAFFDNRRDVTTGSGDVTGHDVDAPPVVASWSGPLTILQAYERAVACLVTTNRTSSPLDWSCSDHRGHATRGPVVLPSEIPQ